MSGLILFAILGIWSVALYYLGYRLSWFVSKKWARQLVGVTAVIGVTTVVLWDEIQGAKEFEILCVSARKFEIAPSDEGKKFDRLVELNVEEQVKNLSKTTIVQRAWANRELPHLHGWVFDMRTGLIKEIMNIDSNSELEEIFKYKFDKLSDKDNHLVT